MLDYLQHAECIKEKSTTEVYCGSHYSRYVTMIMTRSLQFLLFQARGYGQGSHALDTEGALLLTQSLQGRIIKRRLGQYPISSSGLRPSRDPSVRGQRPDVGPGLRPGDARQEPRLPAQAVPGDKKKTVWETKLYSMVFRITYQAGLTALGTTFRWKRPRGRWWTPG